MNHHIICIYMYIFLLNINEHYDFNTLIIDIDCYNTNIFSRIYGHYYNNEVFNYYDQKFHYIYSDIVNIFDISRYICDFFYYIDEDLYVLRVQHNLFIPIYIQNIYGYIYDQWSTNISLDIVD
jgi:hypothetical protein